MTKKGKNYNVYYEYITNGDGKLVNEEFNKAVLYKNYNNKENQINEILWALNITGYECKNIPIRVLVKPMNTEYLENST